MLGCTVITVVKNGALSIEKTLLSVNGQTYSNIEHLVIVGNSTDGTLDVVRRFNSKKSLHIFSDSGLGIYQAINCGLQKARNEIIFLLHSDDVFAHENVISAAMAIFEFQSVDFAYGGVSFVTDRSKVVRYWWPGEILDNDVFWGYMFPHTSLFCRKEVFEKIGNYDESFKIAGDYDFILRLINSDLHGVLINDCLVEMAIGGASNNSIKNVFRKIREDRRAVKKNHVGGYLTVIFKRIRKVSQFLNYF